MRREQLRNTKARTQCKVLNARSQWPGRARGSDPSLDIWERAQQRALGPHYQMRTHRPAGRAPLLQSGGPWFDPKCVYHSCDVSSVEQSAGLRCRRSKVQLLHVAPHITCGCSGTILARTTIGGIMLRLRVLSERWTASNSAS
jgi:hypothetical protein